MELIYAEDSGLLLRCIIRSDNNGSKPPIGRRYGLGESSRQATAQLPGTPPPRWYPSYARVRRPDALRLSEFRCSGGEGGLPSPPRRQMLAKLFLSDSDFISSSFWPANQVVYGFSSGGAHPGRGDQIVSGSSSGGMARHRKMLIRLFLSRSDLSSALAG